MSSPSLCKVDHASQTMNFEHFGLTKSEYLTVEILQGGTKTGKVQDPTVESTRKQQDIWPNFSYNKVVENHTFRFPSSQKTEGFLGV